ncbi:MULTISPECIES: hypothetical protein [Gordonia]|uniref:hypothetical protein n=1 Tax=Gordonia TaxID=2053 RepID=UPI00034A245A|nr:MULTISPECIES: hypothetical protein [Gordonia]KJR06973.1 hypothetical protein UG54_12085 [Gordonia sihwensis]KXT56354.1 hypothetical protein Y710_13950 [Gordonia sp. QH-12]WFN91206.1 hypothetical protein P5P27_10370 [Gordonia sihwensis]
MTTDPEPVELCCQLWARPGLAADLSAYEDEVLALLPDHGGVLLARALGSGTADVPDETQLIGLPDQAALEAYLADPRRTSRSAERDRVVERTVLFPVRVVTPH